MSPRGVWKVESRSRINQVPAYTTEQLFTDHQLLALKSPGIKQQPVPGRVFTFCLHLSEQEPWVSTSTSQAPNPALLSSWSHW